MSSTTDLLNRLRYFVEADAQTQDDVFLKAEPGGWIANQDWFGAIPFYLPVI